MKTKQQIENEISQLEFKIISLKGDLKAISGTKLLSMVKKGKRVFTLVPENQIENHINNGWEKIHKKDLDNLLYKFCFDDEPIH